MEINNKQMKTMKTNKNITIEVNETITRESIREDIFSLQDETYREFHSRLVPGESAIIGVRVPVLRQYAKMLSKAWGKSINGLLEMIGNDYYEEIMLQGMLIGIQKKPERDALFRQIEAYVPKISNWALCDVFCAGLKEVKKYPDETYEFLQKYLASDAEYDIRFGVVMLLDYYVREDYLERIFQITEGITHEGYYVKMAVAWLLSVCFVKFYDETKAFMQNCTLDAFTYNKALQKARESFRLTPCQKEELQRMKTSKKA